MGCHSFLQGIFLTQEQNSRFSSSVGRFFTILATREVCLSVYYMPITARHFTHCMFFFFWCVCVCSVVFNCLPPHGCRQPGSSLSIEFCRQKYWSGLTFPTPADLPHSGMELGSLRSPALISRRILYHCATWEAHFTC